MSSCEERRRQGSAPEDHLDGDKVVGVVRVRFDEGRLGRHGELSRVFEDVGLRAIISSTGRAR